MPGKDLSQIAGTSQPISSYRRVEAAQDETSSRRAAAIATAILNQADDISNPDTIGLGVTLARVHPQLQNHLAPILNRCIASSNVDFPFAVLCTCIVDDSYNPQATQTLLPHLGELSEEKLSELIHRIAKQPFKGHSKQKAAVLLTLMRHLTSKEKDKEKEKSYFKRAVGWFSKLNPILEHFRTLIEAEDFATLRYLAERGSEIPLNAMRSDITKVLIKAASTPSSPRSVEDLTATLSSFLIHADDSDWKELVKLSKAFLDQLPPSQRAWALHLLVDALIEKEPPNLQAILQQLHPAIQPTIKRSSTLEEAQARTLLLTALLSAPEKLYNNRVAAEKFYRDMTARLLGSCRGKSEIHKELFHALYEAKSPLAWAAFDHCSFDRNKIIRKLFSCVKGPDDVPKGAAEYVGDWDLDERSLASFLILDLYHSPRSAVKRLNLYSQALASEIEKKEIERTIDGGFFDERMPPDVKQELMQWLSEQTGAASAAASTLDLETSREKLTALAYKDELYADHPLILSLKEQMSDTDYADLRLDLCDLVLTVSKDSGYHRHWRQAALIAGADASEEKLLAHLSLDPQYAEDFVRRYRESVRSRSSALQITLVSALMQTSKLKEVLGTELFSGNWPQEMGLDLQNKAHQELIVAWLGAYLEAGSPIEGLVFLHKDLLPEAPPELVAACAEQLLTRGHVAHYRQRLWGFMVAHLPFFLSRSPAQDRPHLVEELMTPKFFWHRPLEMQETAKAAFDQPDWPQSIGLDLNNPHDCRALAILISGCLGEADSLKYLAGTERFFGLEVPEELRTLITLQLLKGSEDTQKAIAANLAKDEGRLWHGLSSLDVVRSMASQLVQTHPTPVPLLLMATWDLVGAALPDEALEAELLEHITSAASALQTQSSGRLETMQAIIDLMDCLDVDPAFSRQIAPLLLRASRDDLAGSRLLIERYFEGDLGKLEALLIEMQKSDLNGTLKLLTGGLSQIIPFDRLWKIASAVDSKRGQKVFTDLYLRHSGGETELSKAMKAPETASAALRELLSVCLQNPDSLYILHVHLRHKLEGIYALIETTLGKDQCLPFLHCASRHAYLDHAVKWALEKGLAGDPESRIELVKNLLIHFSKGYWANPEEAYKLLGHVIDRTKQPAEALALFAEILPQAINSDLIAKCITEIIEGDYRGQMDLGIVAHALVVTQPFLEQKTLVKLIESLRDRYEELPTSAYMAPLLRGLISNYAPNNREVDTLLYTLLDDAPADLRFSILKELLLKDRNFAPTRDVIDRWQLSPQERLSLFFCQMMAAKPTPHEAGGVLLWDDKQALIDLLAKWDIDDRPYPLLALLPQMQNWRKGAIPYAQLRGEMDKYGEELAGFLPIIEKAEARVQQAKGVAKRDQETNLSHTLTWVIATRCLLKARGIQAGQGDPRIQALIEIRDKTERFRLTEQFLRAASKAELRTDLSVESSQEASTSSAQLISLLAQLYGVTPAAAAQSSRSSSAYQPSLFDRLGSIRGIFRDRIALARLVTLMLRPLESDLSHDDRQVYLEVLERHPLLNPQLSDDKRNDYLSSLPSNSSGHQELLKFLRDVNTLMHMYGVAILQKMNDRDLVADVSQWARTTTVQRWLTRMNLSSEEADGFHERIAGQRGIEDFANWLNVADRDNRDMYLQMLDEFKAYLSDPVEQEKQRCNPESSAHAQRVFSDPKVAEKWMSSSAVPMADLVSGIDRQEGRDLANTVLGLLDSSGGEWELFRSLWADPRKHAALSTELDQAYKGASARIAEARKAELAQALEVSRQQRQAEQAKFQKGEITKAERDQAIQQHKNAYQARRGEIVDRFAQLKNRERGIYELQTALLQLAQGDDAAASKLQPAIEKAGLKISEKLQEQLELMEDKLGKGKDKYRGFVVRDTGDFWTAVFAGEAGGSCLNLSNRTMLDNTAAINALAVDGKNRLLVVTEQKSGKSVARIIMRLLWDQSRQCRVIFLEDRYGGSTLDKEALIKLAQRKGRQMGMDVVTTETNYGGDGGPYPSDPRTVLSLGTRAVEEHTERGSGSAKGFHISNPLLYVYKHK